MPKSKKIKKEIRETDKSWRWSQCLKMATTAYHSTMNSHEIDQTLDTISDYFQRTEN